MLTDDEKRELIAEAGRVGNYMADIEYYEYRLIARLADALEGTLTEPEWEYGVVGPTGRMVNNGDYQTYQTHRRRKAGPWEVVPDV